MSEPTNHDPGKCELCVAPAKIVLRRTIPVPHWVGTRQFVLEAPRHPRCAAHVGTDAHEIDGVEYQQGASAR